MKIKQYTSKKRTEEYLLELRKWVDFDREKKGYLDSDLDDKPDSRDFPFNSDEDIILIIKAQELYIPDACEAFMCVDYNRCSEEENVDFLEKTVAEVLGFSDIDYYAPWEEDLELKCKDGESRYLHAIGAGGTFTFIPHPSKFDAYKEFIPLLPRGSKGVEELLKKYYGKIKK
ncbi:hypothetical protein GOV06_05495 [Candidatus Woesearchaeota archaeon]|nr:hypothetical protein [Candidatus Woesearchaeota archaeon]